jgi:hypothetical protein
MIGWNFRELWMLSRPGEILTGDENVTVQHRPQLLFLVAKAAGEVWIISG